MRKKVHLSECCDYSPKGRQETKERRRWKNNLGGFPSSFRTSFLRENRTLVKWWKLEHLFRIRNFTLSVFLMTLITLLLPQQKLHIQWTINLFASSMKSSSNKELKSENSSFASLPVCSKDLQEVYESFSLFEAQTASSFSLVGTKTNERKKKIIYSIQGEKAFIHM